nr:non-ribosomal peptide synthetase [Tumebacillus amylolyticus]
MFCSYNDFYTRCLRVLHLLQQKGVRPKQEVVLQINDEGVFLHLFWACVLGGFVPVPCTVGANDEHRLKLLKIWDVLHEPVLAIEANIWARFADIMGDNPLVADMQEHMLSVESLMEVADQDDAPLGTVYEASADDIAFIQFSSGSTGDPKGVVLTHANVVHNLHAILQGAQVSANDSCLSWMPLTHDMGLIGMHLMSLCGGIPFFLISTETFMRRPALWLTKINEHRVTMTSSPNFGYKLFLTTFKQKVATEWNLSCLRLIFNGAEPISHELCNRFLDEMAAYGLSRETMFTVYGLAESTVGSVFPEPGTPMRPVLLDRRSLVTGQEVVELAESERDKPYAVSFLDHGKPVSDVNLRICDEENRELADRFVGYIQISGACVTSGYYNNPVATAKAKTADGWLNTGDLGFLRDGRLVVTGRAKDVLFVNGQNLYPHDIERVAEEVEGVELGKVAVTGLHDPALQRDVVLVFVTFKHKVPDFAPIAWNVQRCLSRKMGLRVDHVLPIRSLPKTTSGKLQRYKLGERFQEGEFSEIVNELQSCLLDLRLQEKIVPPQNEVEDVILKLWQEVLQRDSISVDENFFELGGTSTLVAQIVTRLEQLYPDRVKISDPYSLPTIRAMADHILSVPRVLELSQITMPSSFYARGGGGEESVHLRTGAALATALRRASEENGGTLHDLLAVLYANLLGQVAGLQQVEVQVVDDVKRIAPLRLKMDATLSDAMKLVQDGPDSPDAYSFAELSRMTRSRTEHGILPCFHNRELWNGNVEWLQAYDLVLQVEAYEDGLNLACLFDGRRLRKEKVKELLTLYVRLLQHLAGKYSSGREHHAPTV